MSIGFNDCGHDFDKAWMMGTGHFPFLSNGRVPALAVIWLLYVCLCRFETSVLYLLDMVMTIPGQLRGNKKILKRSYIHVIIPECPF